MACIPYSEIELSAKFMDLNFWVYRIEISFIIVFTPNRIEYRFRVSGYFFEFILLYPYLNIFAFYKSGFSPVSWHREMNSSTSCKSGTVLELLLEHVLNRRSVYCILGCFR